MHAYTLGTSHPRNMRVVQCMCLQVPKRGLPTPRYLLKLRTEVEIMQQLGFSLDAVNLKDVFEDDEAIHLVSQKAIK